MFDSCVICGVSLPERKERVDIMHWPEGDQTEPTDEGESLCGSCWLPVHRAIREARDALCLKGDIG